MKTKTLDVYLFSEEPFSGLQTLSHIAKELNKEAGYTIKAKLTIDLPEKKVEVTESDINKLFDASNVSSTCDEQFIYKDQLLKAFFGNENE